MEREQIRGVQAALLSFTLWGLLTVYWKQLSALNPFEMIGWRVISATVILTIFCMSTERWSQVRTALGDRSLLPRLFGAGLLLIGNWTSYVWAVTNDRVIETALGYFLAPLFTMLIGAFVYHEGLPPLRRAAVASTVVAVAVLTISYGNVPWVALLLAGSWSWYSVTKRSVPLGPFVSLTSELYTIVVPAAVAVGIGFAHADGIPRVATGVEWPLLIGTGVITALPLTLFAFAAPRVPFTLLGPLNFLVPIINFVLGWIIYGEAMTTSRFIGFGFVWIALLLVTVDTTLGESRRNRKLRISATPR